MDDSGARGEPGAEGLRELIPAYARLARETTLLNPAPGETGTRESSLGGDPLWPADEPWPHCAEEGHWTYRSDRRDTTPSVPGRVPMVPILQLFARDVPKIAFPEGTDLLQLVWCALNHDEDPEPVRPRLYWRNEAEVLARGPLTVIPRAGEGEYDEDLVPVPSTLSPVVAEDFPRWLDLPAELWESWQPLIRAASTGADRPSDANLVGTKTGGWPAWTQRADWPDCACGHRMEHLLTITGDIQLGDCGGVYLFHCTRCPGRPWDWRFDCH